MSNTKFEARNSPVPAGQAGETNTNDPNSMAKTLFVLNIHHLNFGIV